MSHQPEFEPGARSALHSAGCPAETTLLGQSSSHHCGLQFSPPGVHVAAIPARSRKPPPWQLSNPFVVRIEIRNGSTPQSYVGLCHSTALIAPVCASSTVIPPPAVLPRNVTQTSPQATSIPLTASGPKNDSSRARNSAG